VSTFHRHLADLSVSSARHFVEQAVGYSPDFYRFLADHGIWALIFQLAHSNIPDISSFGVRLLEKMAKSRSVADYTLFVREHYFEQLGDLIKSAATRELKLSLCSAATSLSLGHRLPSAAASAVTGSLQELITDSPSPSHIDSGFSLFTRLARSRGLLSAFVLCSLHSLPPSPFSLFCTL
jgi:hypothetical protein